MNKLTCIAFLVTAGVLHAELSTSAQVAEGKHVFQTSCAVGYCHGLDGRAGHGPRLRDRVWSRSYLYTTIAQGIPGSSMPAWRGRLSDARIAAVISYIFTLSQPEPAAGKKIKPSQTTHSEVAREPAGRALFFDLTRDRNCGVCHRIADTGSHIAPPFAAIRGTPAKTLLNQIKSQPLSENNIRVSLKSGEEFCGIKAADSQSSLRVYDLGGKGPPVLRTLARDSVGAIRACQELNVHADNSSSYSAQELLSIVAFLDR